MKRTLIGGVRRLTVFLSATHNTLYVGMCVFKTKQNKAVCAVCLMKTAHHHGNSAAVPVVQLQHNKVAQ